MAHHAVATGAVDHVHRLTQFFLEQGAHNARCGIGAAACSPRHDQGDGARGVALRLRSGAKSERCERANECLHQGTANHHGVSYLLNELHLHLNASQLAS